MARVYTTQTNAAGTDLAAKVTGKTSGIVEIPVDNTLSTALSVGANTLLKQRERAKITKSGSATVTLGGIGLDKPTSRIPLFANFLAGDVKWTGLEIPAEIHAALWRESSSTFTDLLNRANKAFPLVMMTVSAAGAASGAASVPLTANTSAAMLKGTILKFGAKTVILSADVAAGVNSLPVNTPHDALVSGDKAYFSRQVKITVSPGNINNYTFLEPNRVIEFEPGLYASDFNQATFDNTTGLPIAERQYTSTPINHRGNLQIIMSPLTRIMQSVYAVSGVNKEGFLSPQYFHGGYENLFIDGRGAIFVGSGGINTGSAKSVIDTGNVRRGVIENLGFDGTTGYCITTGGGEFGDTVGLGLYPEDITVRNCWANNVWSQVFNIVRGLRCKIENTQITVGNPSANCYVAFWDLEPNSVEDKVEYCTLSGATLYFNYDGTGHTAYATAIAVQGSALGERHIKITGSRIYAKNLLSSGIQVCLYAYGVEHLDIYDEFYSGSFDLAAKIDKCRHVKFRNVEIADCTKAIKFRAVNDLTFKDVKFRDILYPGITEEEEFHPVLANGANLELARPFGMGATDNNERYRVYPHYVGLDVSFKNADRELTDHSLPPSTRLATEWNTLETNADFGTATTFTFTSSDVSGNTVTKTAHGRKTGDPVNLTGGTLAMTNFYKRAYIIRLTDNTFQFAGTLKKALDGTPETISSVTGTITVAPFSVSSHCVAPSAVNTSTNEITLPTHNYVDKMFLDYDNYGGTKIGGLFVYGDSDLGVNKRGVYVVKVVSPTTIKLCETEDDFDNPTPIYKTLTSAGTGTHIFTPVAETRFSDNKYFVPEGVPVTLHKHSKSKVYLDTDYGVTPLGTLPTENLNYPITSSDTMRLAVAKLSHQTQNPPEPPYYPLDDLSVQPRKAFAAFQLGSAQTVGAKVRPRSSETEGDFADIGFTSAGGLDAAQMAAEGTVSTLEIRYTNQGADGTGETTVGGTGTPVAENALLGFPVRKMEANEIVGLGAASGYSAAHGFFLVKKLTDGANNTFLTMGSSGNTMHYPFSDVIYDDFFSTTRKTAGSNLTTLGIDLSEWHVYEVWSASGDWSNNINGTVIHTTGTNTVSTPALPKLTADSDLLIGAAIIFNQKLSTDDRNVMRTFFERFGITFA